MTCLLLCIAITWAAPVIDPGYRIVGYMVIRDGAAVEFVGDMLRFELPEPANGCWSIQTVSQRTVPPGETWMDRPYEYYDLHYSSNNDHGYYVEICLTGGT